MTLGNELHDQLEALEWDVDHLANACDVSRVKAKQWLEGNGSFRPTIEDISRIAYGLAWGYDQKGGPKGPGDLGEIFVKLLAAAGYRLDQVGRSREFLSPRVAETPGELRVAFANWPSLIYETPEGNVVGPMADLTRWIGKLAYRKIKFVIKEWNSLRPALSCNEAHLTCPIMNVPSRDYLFSDDIPGLQIGVSAVTASVDTELPAHRLELNFVEGEVGLLVGEYIFLGASVEDRPPHQTVDQALDFIRANPNSPHTGYARALVLDSEMCRNLAARQPGLRLLTGAPEPFPLAFGAHPADEQQIDLVNRCIRRLNAWGYFRHAWSTVSVASPSHKSDSLRPC